MDWTQVIELANQYANKYKDSADIAADAIGELFQGQRASVANIRRRVWLQVTDVATRRQRRKLRQHRLGEGVWTVPGREADPADIVAALDEEPQTMDSLVVDGAETRIVTLRLREAI